MVCRMNNEMYLEYVENKITVIVIDTSVFFHLLDETKLEKCMRVVIDRLVIGFTA